MKFPSIAVLTRGLWTTLRRWPLTILLAVITSVLLMQAFNRGVDDRDRVWMVILSCYEAMLLTIAATILAEARLWRRGWKVVLQVLALALAFWFYYALPAQDSPRIMRFLVVTLALHLLIAFLPYAAVKDSPIGFWDYNRKLFLRGLQSVLYTVVLFIGIALALGAISVLFGVNVEHAISDVWCLLFGVFNTIFYLAGFPSVYAQPAGINDYPRGLKVFTQFVLLPLVTIYLGILYAYLFKIIFIADWPSGSIVYLVLGYSVAGILALLLIHPLRNDPDNRWIRSYSKLFYLALIPLIILLWLAIWKRVGAYGITEPRYYVLLLSVWLTAMVFYFVLSRNKDIRIIPASLCVLALLSLFGPWGAGSVSLASQKARLKVLLIRNGLFVDGKIVPAKDQPVFKDRREITDIVSYITGMHSYRDLQPWFRTNLDTYVKNDPAVRENTWRDQSESLLNLIGVKEAYSYTTDTTVRMAQETFAYYNRAASVLHTTGVAYVIPDLDLSAMTGADSSWNSYRLDKNWLKVRLDSTRHLVEIASNRDLSGGPLDLQPLEKAIRDSAAAGQLDSLLTPAMTLDCPGFRIIFTKVTGIHTDSWARVTGATGYLLVLEGGRPK